MKTKDVSTGETAGSVAWEVLEQVGAATAISSAVESGLLLALSLEPRTAPELARSLALDPPTAQLLLEVLAAEGLALQKGGSFIASPALATALGNMPRQGLASWRGLTTVLHGGEPPVMMDADPDARAQAYREVTPALSQMFSFAAEDLARRLGPWGRVLDLGCGAGAWGFAMAKVDPEAEVLAVDFPDVLDVALPRAKSLGVEAQVQLLAADVRSDPLPGGFDTVILANLLRLEPAPIARDMLLRAAKCAAPGGRVVVVDAIEDGSKEARRSLALYALNLSLRTERGVVHAPSEIERWMRAADLHDPHPLALRGGPPHLGALVGTR